WETVAGRVPRFAAALRALGLAEGGRVAILALNSDDYLELHYAIVWAGGAMVPINTRLAPAEIGYILGDSAPDILIADQHCLAQLPQPLPAVIRHKIFLGEQPPAGWLAYEQLIRDHAPMPDCERRDGDLAGIFYTGG